MPTSKGTELVPFTGYSLAKYETNDLLETIRENVGSGAITPFDLERVRIPTGGGKVWSVPTLEEEPEYLPLLDGIIVYHREPRAYWPVAFASSGGGTPPACASQFGDVGVGDPGGECAPCPYSQWGTGTNERGEATRGQACKQMKLTFVLRNDGLLPLALFLPPTSLIPMRKYLLGLASRGQHYSSVITRFALDNAVSDVGITYSMVKPTRLSVLDEAEAAKVREYSQAIRHVLDTVEITEADVTDTPLPDEPVDPDVAAAAERLGATVEPGEPF